MLFLLDVWQSDDWLQLREWVAELERKRSPLVGWLLVVFGGADPLLSVEQLKVIHSVRLWHDPWLINRVQNKLAHVIHHFRQQLLHIIVGHAQVWVRVHLDEPYAIVLIYQEVEAKQLVSSLPIIRIQTAPRTQKSVNHDVLDPVNEITLNIDFSFFIGFI